MTAALELVPVALARLDASVAELAWARLTRREGRLVLECLEGERERARVLLARAGAELRDAQAAPPAPRGWVPARVHTLAPLGRTDVVDAVVLRAVCAAEATSHLSRGPLTWALRRRRDESGMRAVLRGEAHLFAWRRVMWARPATLRLPEMRVARPVIFDRDGVDRGPERFAWTGADALTAWARA